MILGLKIPTTRPSSAEEAVLWANQSLESAGLDNAKATLLKAPTPPAAFAGAVAEVNLPEQSLAGLFDRIVKAKAAENGGKVTQSALRFNDLSHNCVRISLGVTASVMMATIQLQITGEAYLQDAQNIGLRKLSLDAGSGMFAGMAAAMIRPKLTALESDTFDVAKWTGMPLSIETLTVGNGVLKIRASVLDPLFLSTSKV